MAQLIVIRHMAQHPSPLAHVSQKATLTSQGALRDLRDLEVIKYGMQN